MKVIELHVEAEFEFEVEGKSEQIEHVDTCNEVVINIS